MMGDLRIRYMDKKRRYIGYYDASLDRWHQLYINDCPLWMRVMASNQYMEDRMRHIMCVKGGGLYFKPNCRDAAEVAREFRITNPDWITANKLRKKGKRVPMPDQWLYAAHRLPVDHNWANGIILPLFCSSTRFHLDVVNRQYEGDPLEHAQLSEDFSPRGYQQDAIDMAVRHGHGIIRAPCGSGKTAIGVGIIGAFKRKTLVLVHTGDLVLQWRSRLAMWMPEAMVGVTGMGKKEVGDVTIATVQTLAKMRWTELYEWSKQFGVVILDEAHHAPAQTFSFVLTAIPARNRFGLTATPKRADGLTPFLWWSFGFEIWKIDHQSLVHNNLIMLPEFSFIDTMWTPKRSSEDYSRVVTEMTLSESRNETILDIATRCASEGRCVLILSDRVGHCEALAEELGRRGIDAAALVGRLSNKKRAALIEAMNAGELSVCTATTIADEGLDIPKLDTLIMATPSSSLGRVEQRVGRIMRPAPDKQAPLVFDLRDSWGPFRGGARKRESLYRSLGMQRIQAA